MILVRAERWPDALWAMEEALRCPAVTGAVLALAWEANRQAGDDRLDLTATRRLQLAAETSGSLGLLLRPDTADPAPTAAVTRWRVGPLPTAQAGTGLDDPRWQLELLRARGGKPGGPWAVTWRAAEGRLDLEREETAPAVRASGGAFA